MREEATGNHDYPRTAPRINALRLRPPFLPAGPAPVPAPAPGRFVIMCLDCGTNDPPFFVYCRVLYQRLQTITIKLVTTPTVRSLPTYLVNILAPHCTFDA
jgi:hypothetical protein